MKPERGMFPCFWSSRNSRPSFPMSRSPCRLPSAPCRFTSIPACAGISSCSAKGRVRCFRAKERFPSVRCCLRIRARFSPRRFQLTMTRTDIADYLGLTVETVSRSFTRLRQEGSIATDDPHHVRLLNRKRLDALAEARA